MSTTQLGYTPLVTAAWCGKWDVFIELLENGADINAQDNVSPTLFLNNFKSVVTFGAVVITPT